MNKRSAALFYCLLVLACFCPSIQWAQQETIFSLYRHHLNIQNPAAVGLAQSSAINLSTRIQWLGVEDAPWGLSQVVFAQSLSVTQLFEGLEQFSIEEVNLVLEERLEEWLLRFKDKPALLAASTGPLLNTLEGQGYFKAATFLSERLLDHDRCDFDSRLQKKLDHYKNIQEGKKAPQLSFDAPGSLQLNFLEQQETEKQLLVFWSSGCPHCLDALPQLARLQNKLAEQDISLLSISLDREEATFRKTASTYPWVHYSDFQGWDSPAVKAYHVFATPSFFLVNAKGVLEKEFISVEQIRDFSTSPPYGRQATTLVHFDRSGEIYPETSPLRLPAAGFGRSDHGVAEKPR